MAILNDFSFTQNKLQDFIDCSRRFELKYLLNQTWPAAVTEPMLEFEHHQQLGQRFHLLVQQHLSGVTQNYLDASIDDATLMYWWKNYLSSPPYWMNETYFVEFMQFTNLIGFKLIAKYDVLIVKRNQEIIIIDWKTTRWRLSGRYLQNHVQTIVYPFVATEVGLENKKIEPSYLQMIYWFPEFPDNPEIISYSTLHHQQNQELLTKTIERIIRCSKDNFPLTDDLRKCTFCNYRSLCRRGVNAGNWSVNDESELLGEEEEVESSFISENYDDDSNKTEIV